MKISCYLIMILLFSNLVLAVGISPGIKELTVESEKESVYTLRVYNNDKQNMDISLYSDGWFKDYVRIEPSSLHFNSNEAMKPVIVYVNLPAGKDVSDVRGFVKARQQLAGSGISVAAEVASILLLNKKAVVGSSDALKDVNVGVDIKNRGLRSAINVTVANVGQVNISKSSVIVETVDYENKSLAKIESDGFKLNVGETEAVLFNANLNPGVYKALIYVLYDGENKVLEREIVINYFELNKTEMVLVGNKEISTPNFILIMGLWILVLSLIIINLIRYKYYIIGGRK